MSVILKHQGDIDKAQAELGKLLAEKAAEKRSKEPVAAAPTAVKKSVLH
jgi:hypothetical protein